MKPPVMCEVCGHDGYADKLIPCLNAAICCNGRHVWCLEGGHQHEEELTALLAEQDGQPQLQCWHCAQLAAQGSSATTSINRRPVPAGNRTGGSAFRQKTGVDGEDDEEEPEVAYDSAEAKDLRPSKRARAEPVVAAAATAGRAAGIPAGGGGGGAGKAPGRGGLASMLPPQPSGRRVQADQPRLGKLEDDIDAFDDLAASPVKTATLKGHQPGMSATRSRLPGVPPPPPSSAAGRDGVAGTSQAAAASTRTAAPVSRPPISSGRGRVAAGRGHPTAKNRSSGQAAFNPLSAVASRAPTTAVAGASSSLGIAGLNRAAADPSPPTAAAGQVEGAEPVAGQASDEKKEREPLWKGSLSLDSTKRPLQVTLTALFPHEAMEQLADKMNPKRDNLQVTWRVPSAEEIPACISKSRDFYAQDGMVPCETCIVMDVRNVFAGAPFEDLLSMVCGTSSKILVAEFPTLKRADLAREPILSRLLACTPPPPQEGRVAQVWEPPYRLYFTPSVVPADRFDMEKGSKQLFLCLTGSRFQIQELSTWDKQWAGTPIIKFGQPEGMQAAGPVKKVAWRMAGSDDDGTRHVRAMGDKGIAQRERLQEKEKDIRNTLKVVQPSAEEEAELAAAEVEAGQTAAGPGGVQLPAAEPPAAAEAEAQPPAASSQLIVANQAAIRDHPATAQQQPSAVLQGPELQPQQSAPEASVDLAEDSVQPVAAGLAGPAANSPRPDGHLDASVEEDAETGTPTAEVASKAINSAMLSTGAGARGQQEVEATVPQILHPAPDTAGQEPNWRNSLPVGVQTACVSSSGRLWSWRDVQVPSLAAEHLDGGAQTATMPPAQWKWSQRSLPVLQMPCMEQPNRISRELRSQLPHLWSDLQVLHSAPLRGLRLLLVASEVEKRQMEAGLQQAQQVLGLKWTWRDPSTPAPEDLSESQVLALGSSALETLPDRASSVYLKSVGVHPIHVFRAEPLVNSLRLLVEEAMQPDDQAGEASVPTLSRAAQLVVGAGLLFPDRVVIMMDAQGFMNTSPQVLRQLLGCLEAGTQAWGEPWTLRMRRADIEQVQGAGGEHGEIVRGALDDAHAPLLMALTPCEESTKPGDKLLRDAVRLLHESKPGRLVVQAYSSTQASEVIVKKGRLCKDVLSGAVEEVLAFLDLLLVNGWQHAGPGLQPM